MPIPEKITASKAVARNERFADELPLAGFARLQGLLAAYEGKISAELQAGRDDSDHPHLQGRLRGALQMVCHRCQKSFDWELDASLAIRLVNTEAEEAQALHESDPYLVENDRLFLREVIEDELLLALPMMPRCKSCENTAPPAPAKEPGTETRKENPFAALKRMKFDGR